MMSFTESFRNIPLVGSETASAYMVRGEYENDEERHKIASYDESCAPWGDTHRDAWRWIVERQFVAGGFIWTGLITGGEPTPFEWPCGSLLRNLRFLRISQRKPVIYIRRSGQMSLWCIWRRRRDEGMPGEPVKVLIISNCQEVEITVNGRLVQEAGRPEPTGTDPCSYESGNLKAVGFRDGSRWRSIRLRRPGKLMRCGSKPAARSFREMVLDALVVNVCAVDEEGNVVSDADQTVSFELSEEALN